MSPDQAPRVDDPASSLRAYLLGAWELESYVDIAEDGLVAGKPLGDDARGMLIYSSDGFMSAQLARVGRRPFLSGDWFAPTPAEMEGASRYIGYCGRYSVDEEARSVVHEVAISFFPNWEGHAQMRRARRTDRGLVLTPDKPIRSGGRLVTPCLTWARPVRS